GLPAGTEAPAFALPDLDGNAIELMRWRGQRLLLIFFNPGCGFCTDMAPDLADLPFDCTGGSPIPIVVAAGRADLNRAWVEAHNVRCPVLLDEDGAIAAAYAAKGT